MSLVEEYRRQLPWRDWGRALSTCAPLRVASHALREKRYDFRAGRRLASTFETQGFRLTTTELADRELAFDGPASPEVLAAWRARLSRMVGLKTFLGRDFADFADSFYPHAGISPASGPV